MFNPHYYELMDEYLIFYPDIDEEGFDGVHYGGIKGLRDDAPDYVKDIYKEYMELVERGKRDHANYI